MSQFIGSVWFGVMLALAGYLAGNLFPVGKIADMFKK